MASCTAIKASGERCKGIAITGAQWCPAHHPDHAARRQKHAKKGGKLGGRGRPTSELAALRSENGELRKRMLEGELEPRTVAVAVQSINTDIRATEVLLKAREQEELEARMERIEAVLEAKKNGMGRRLGA
jgi:hypothetical protein